MASLALLDLPKDFLATLLAKLGDDARTLLFVSKSTLVLASKVGRLAFARWGPASKDSLEQLPLESVAALLLPDSSKDFELPAHLRLDGLQTAVLSYR